MVKYVNVAPYKASTATLQDPARQHGHSARRPSSLRAVSSRPSLVVVGAGVFGASLARHCALAGWDVVLVERVAPGHVRAGSGDESRLIRCCHGADAWHTRSARRAWALWHEIDPALVVDCGRRVARAPRRRLGGRGRGRPARRGDPVRARRRDRAVPERRRRRRALHALRARGRDPARPRRGEDARRAGGGGRRRARAGRGAARRRGGRRSTTAGGWRPTASSGPAARGCRALFPGLLDLRITQQDVFYFGAPRGLAHARRARLGRLRRRGLRPRRPRRARREGLARRRRAADATPRRCERVAVPEHERLARDVPRRTLPGPGRRAAGRRSRLPVRDHARHALRHRAAPRPRRARVAAGRRLGPRLQARPGAGRALRALAARAPPSPSRASAWARAAAT